MLITPSSAKLLSPHGSKEISLEMISLQVKKNFHRMLALLLYFVLLSPLAASPDRIVSNTNDDGNGSLRNCMIYANNASLFAESEVDLRQLQAAHAPAQAVITLTSGSININRRMTWITDPALPKVVIRRASGNFRMVSIASDVSGAVVLEHLIFENGLSDRGAAIDYSQSSSGAQLTLTNCEFVGNISGSEIEANRPSSARGGAIYFVSNAVEGNTSSLLIDGCRFESNRALSSNTPEGAAVYVSQSPLIIRNSVFRANQCVGIIPEGIAADPIGGGAVCVAGFNRPAMMIERCFFDSNISTGSSALRITVSSIPVTPSPDEIRDTTFHKNSGYGPALQFSSSVVALPARLRNCTFAENIGNYASCMLLFRTSVTLEHCTISRNTHESNGGGAIRLGSSSQSTLTLNRSVIAGNLHLGANQNTLYSPDIARITGTIVSQGYNFIGSANGITAEINGTDDLKGTNVSPLNPQLAMPGNYGGPVPTMPPLPESPLVDGMPQADSNVVPIDARGVTRPQGVRGDIGAVELPRVAYTTWHLQIANVAERDQALDPDKDGLVNLMEYLCGTNPAVPNGNPLRMVQEGGGRYVEVMRSTQIRPALFTLISLETSTTLQGWVPAGIEPIATPAVEGSIDRMRYLYPLDNYTDPRRFFQMKAQ